MSNNRLPLGHQWLIKARDVLFKDQKDKANPEAFHPAADKVKGFCWAGSTAECYAFHADEFDKTSQKLFDERLFLLHDLSEHPEKYLSSIERTNKWMSDVSLAA